MTIAETSPQPDTDSRKSRTRPRRPLGDHVARTVGGLQARALMDIPQPEAISALARLRRGLGRMPGFDYTLDGYLYVPDNLLGKRSDNDGEASDAEHAVHDAITHYALHQQSKRDRMHKDGRGLGGAMAELVRVSPNADGVRRRFAALGTATTYSESVYHLRSLIMMLREHAIPLDYGLLADDLESLRRTEGRTQTQAAWGREFFRHRPVTDSDQREEKIPS